jgi:hypothetical protein
VGGSATAVDSDGGRVDGVEDEMDNERGVGESERVKELRQRERRGEVLEEAG